MRKAAEAMRKLTEAIRLNNEAYHAREADARARAEQRSRFNSGGFQREPVFFDTSNEPFIYSTWTEQPKPPTGWTGYERVSPLRKLLYKRKADHANRVNLFNLKQAIK